jgi:hypothetical protein
MSVLSFTSSRLILNMLEFGMHSNAAFRAQQNLDNHIRPPGDGCTVTTNVEFEMGAFTQYRGDSQFDPSRITCASSAAAV